MGFDRAFCFETSQELDAFLQRSDAKVVDYIPLTYQAYTHASGKGLIVGNIYDQITDVEYRQHKEMSENKIAAFVTELNTFSQKIDVDIELGSYFYFQIQIVLGMLHLRSFLFQSALKSRSYKKIIFFEKQKPSGLLMGFRPHFENYYLDLARLYLGNAAVETIAFLDDSEVTKTGWKNFVAKFIYQGPFSLFNFYAHFREKVRFTSAGQKTIGFLWPLYDWRPLLPELATKFKLKFYFQEFFPRENTKYLDDLSSRMLGHESLFWLGKDVFPLVQEQLKVIAEVLTYIQKKKKSYISEIKKINVLFTSVTPYPLQGFFAHMAQKLGKQTVFFQHGEKGIASEDPAILSTEEMFGDTFLAWGPAVVDFYEPYDFKTVTSVGSSRVFNLLKENLKPQNREYILYATGKSLKDSHYFITVRNPDQLLVESQRALYQLFSSLKDKIIFRKNNTRFFDETAVDFSKLSNVTVFDEDFSASLKRAKMIILDAPATTCIEACATDVPLFVLCNRAVWSEKALVSLKKRAVVEKDINVLVDKIKAYLLTGAYEADRQNKEFLLNLGTPDLQQNPLERIHEFIHKLLK